VGAPESLQHPEAGLGWPAVGPHRHFLTVAQIPPNRASIRPSVLATSVNQQVYRFETVRSFI